ncbi:MAG TPA: FAD-binding oxidoreductase, partial [Nocardioidaceae bacterium]|nr:FAD-binding oxidoreductase [Nocardioidaceae bacterium]
MTIGHTAHQRGVDRLVSSYRAIPTDRPVRLAKKTSNLFRVRDDLDAGLDVSDLDSVIEIDSANRTADVQGMATYERIVDTTLPHGYIPYVVPQLRTITLGGAVTGLGIESTSFRNGLPHESVTEMDILTGAGDVVTATPDGVHADLFEAFPNSYGSLGYATRLRILLERVPRYVHLRHVRFDSVARAADAIEEIVGSGEYEGASVDALDGVVFAPDEVYLTVATFSDDASHTSDYTGQQIYYRSIQHKTTDTLRIYDYLWRWDTDWFWCS